MNTIELKLLELQTALKHEMIDLEFIKVSKLPKIDGKEIESFNGVGIKDTIYEHDAEVWIAGKDA